MSLINDMLRDLQQRRSGRVRPVGTGSGGVRPVAAHPNGWRRGLLGKFTGGMLVFVLLGLVGVGGWTAWREFPDWGSVYGLFAERRESPSSDLFPSQAKMPVTSQPHPDALAASESANLEAATGTDHISLSQSVETSPVPASSAEDTRPSAPPETKRPASLDSPPAPQGDVLVTASLQESQRFAPSGVVNDPEEQPDGQPGMRPDEQEDNQTDQHPDKQPGRPAPDDPPSTATSTPDSQISHLSQESQNSLPSPQDAQVTQDSQPTQAWTRPGLWDENPPPPESISRGRISVRAAQPPSLQSTHQRGMLALDRGNPREAEELFRRALEEDPGHEPSLDALLTILLRQNRVPEAEALLRQAGDAGELPIRLTVILARLMAGRGAAEQALEVLDNAPGQERSPEYHALRGAILQQMGRHESAFRAFDTALRGGLHTGTNWAGLAMALEGMGRVGEARVAYKQARALGIRDENLAGYVAGRLKALPEQDGG